MKAVIYARYSCDRQNEQSIEGQLHECYAYAEKHDLTVVKEYIDRALSGRSAEHRTAFQQMIRDSEKKAKALFLKVCLKAWRNTIQPNCRRKSSVAYMR